MTALVLGLLFFLGVHSLRIFANDWRNRQYERLGEARWKGLYSLVSVVGLGLIVWGTGLTRVEPVMVWLPPFWTRHLAALVVLPAFILLVATYVPGNRIRKAAGQPMAAGVMCWAAGHLLSNGRLADLLLFGGFFVWSMLSYSAAQRRDRLAGVQRSGGTLSGDVLTVIIGAVAWAVFAGFLHTWMIGLRPY